MSSAVDGDDVIFKVFAIHTLFNSFPSEVLQNFECNFGAFFNAGDAKRKVFHIVALHCLCFSSVPITKFCKVSGYINGVSYVFPSDLAANATELHQKFFGQEDYVPSAMVSTISGTIASRIEAERNAGNIENEQQEQIDTSQGSVVTEPPQSEGSGNGSESQTGGTGENGKPAPKPEGDGQNGDSEDTPEGDDQTGGSENTPGGDDQTEGSQDGNDGETGGGSGGQTGGSENTPGGGGQTGDNAGAGGTGNGNNNTNAAIAA